MAADPVYQYMSKPDLEKALALTEKQMLRAAKDMEYMEAARLRDDIDMLKNKIAELAN